jgi:importin subunit beta-1
VLALGSILEGPSERDLANPADRHLESMVRQALPILTQLMNDPVVHVKDTAAWTIGRICEFLPEVGVYSASVAPLLSD